MKTTERMLSDKELLIRIDSAIKIITKTFINGGQVLLCGNGGSAADAQHIAAELSGQFYMQREPLNAEALHVNTSYLTAVANDYGFDRVFARALKAKGKQGDILVGLSTSGNSKNVILAFEEAKKMNIFTIALTGNSGGELKKNCDLLLNVPSTDIARIQEGHILIGHTICQFVEKKLFEDNVTF